MAELSAETQAIIERLKEEGNLIRNSETNSIRSVKIEMNKFQGVFDVISANIQEQTSILRQQAGFAAEALEQQKSKEQFDELQKETDDRNDVVDSQRSRELDEKIDRMGDSIANAFTLKNLALAGAGLFVGYNLLKGFVDAQFNGAWSEMEDGVIALGPKLREFANLDLESIRAQFNQLVTDIRSMTTSLASISTSLSRIVNMFERIANMNLLEIAGTVLLAMNSLSAAVWATRYIFRRMTLDLENGRRARGGRTWWQRALGIDPETPDGTPRPTGGGRGNYGMDTPEARAQMRAGINAGNQPPRPIGGGRGTYGIDTPEARAQTRAAAAAARPGQFRLDSQGRLQRPGGGFVSDAEALSSLEEALRASNPKYARIFSGLVRALAVAGVVLTAYDAYRIYSILTDNETFPTDQAKINAIGPIIGPMITTLGAGAIGAIAGGFVGGPWGALIGGAGAAIAAGFLTPDEFGVWIASALFEFAPTEEQRAASRQAAEAAWDATNEFAGFMDSPEYNATPATPPAPTTPQNVRPRPTGSGRNGRAAQLNWDRQYGATHNADGTPIIQGGRGRVVEGAGERAAYQSMLDSLVESEGVAQRRIDEAAQAAAAPIVVISAPTTVSPTVNNVSGGRSVNQVSIRGGGGGGGAFSVFAGNPYGLPYAVN